MNSPVPLRAIVPRYETSSSRSMPMPLSEKVSVPAFLSIVMSMRPFFAYSASSVRLKLSMRSLSIASEAFDISSRTKMSGFE